MEIEIKLFASLRRYAPGDAVSGAMRLAIDDGDTVAQMIETLAIPSEEIKLIFINGVRADRTQALKSGDRLGIFPAVAGG